MSPPGPPTSPREASSILALARCPSLTGRSRALAGVQLGIAAVDFGDMGAKTAAQWPKFGTVLGTLQADVSFAVEAITMDGKLSKVASGRLVAAGP